MGSSNYLGDQHTHSCSPMPDCSVFLALRKQLLYGKMTQPKETTDIVFGDRNVANGAIACSVNATAITSAGGLCNEVQPKLCLVLMDATISTCGLHPACQPYMKYNLSSRCSSHRARSGIPFVGATRFRTNTYSRKVHQVCAFCEFGKFCHVSIQCTAGSNGCVLGLFGEPSSAGCSHWHQTDNNCTSCLDQLCTQQRYSCRCHCWQWW